MSTSKRKPRSGKTADDAQREIPADVPHSASAARRDDGARLADGEGENVHGFEPGGMIGWVRAVFRLDLRSLAAFRLVLGATLLYDFITRLSHYEAFYTDFGVLTRSALTERYDAPWRLSLLALNGSHEYALIFIGIAIAAAAMFTAGWRTAQAGFVCWLCLMSFQNRNPIFSHGGDNLLRLLLFWSWFLPINAYWSIDSLRAEETAARAGPKPKTISNVFSACFVLQLSYVYVFATFYKIDPVWLSKGSAVYYALSLDMYAKPFGQWLVQYNLLTTAMTAATMFIEGFGVVLLLSPWKNQYFRALAVLLFCGLHIGIFLSFRLGTFPPSCLAAWIAMIPTFVWEQAWLKRRLAALVDGAKWKDGVRRVLVKAAAAVGTSNVTRPESLARKGIAVFFIGLITAWNIEGANVIRKFDLQSPWNEIAFALQLQQNWSMFAPMPTRNDGWTVVEAKLADGTTYDILNMHPYTEDKPENVSATVADLTWQKYLSMLWAEDYEDHRAHFCRYLCRRWNSTHRRDEQVVELNLNYMREFTPAPGEPPTPIERVNLWQHRCTR
jgi:hypothetical protein